MMGLGWFFSRSSAFLKHLSTLGKCCHNRSLLLYSVRFRKAKAENIYVILGDALKAALPKEDSTSWILLLPKGVIEEVSPWRDALEEYHLQKNHLPVLSRKQMHFSETRAFQAYF